MKKSLLTFLTCIIATVTFASNLLTESFEYANHDFTPPVGWTCTDDAWLCGYMEKDHNRLPYSGNWYAFSNADDAWLYMPMYLLESMRYRFSLWAISDGDFQLEFWAGSAPDPENMHTQFSSTTISGGEYERVSVYVETIPANSQYFAIRALAGDRSTYLTIDDVEVDMVEQYDFTSEPITGDTAMYPGTHATFRFLVHNIGYDPVDITMHPSTEFFTDFMGIVNGNTGMTFPTQPNETVEVTILATLRPEIEPGTIAWLDIQMTIPCNCNTSMVTFWVTPLDITNTAENNASRIAVYPNPAADFVMVEAEGLRQVMVVDLMGEVMMEVPVEKDCITIGLNHLKRGLYTIIAITDTGCFKRAIVKQ